jgi:hypothetical protein
MACPIRRARRKSIGTETRHSVCWSGHIADGQRSDAFLQAVPTPGAAAAMCDARARCAGGYAWPLFATVVLPCHVVSLLTLAGDEMEPPASLVSVSSGMRWPSQRQDRVSTSKHSDVSLSPLPGQRRVVDPDVARRDEHHQRNRAARADTEQRLTTALAGDQLERCLLAGICPCLSPREFAKGIRGSPRSLINPV